MKRYGEMPFFLNECKDWFFIFTHSVKQLIIYPQIMCIIALYKNTNLAFSISWWNSMTYVCLIDVQIFSWKICQPSALLWDLTFIMYTILTWVQFILSFSMLLFFMFEWVKARPVIHRARRNILSGLPT